LKIKFGEANMKKETRREFLVNLIMGGGILSAFVLFIFNIAKYIYPKLGAPTFRKVVIAKADEIELGQVKEVRFGDQILYLANINGKYKVFSSICTHLGCRVRWEENNQRFFCPCHHAVFDKDGKVLSGPPPRPLDEFKVDVEGRFVYMWVEEKKSWGII